MQSEWNLAEDPRLRVGPVRIGVPEMLPVPPPRHGGRHRLAAKGVRGTWPGASGSPGLNAAIPVAAEPATWPAPAPSHTCHQSLPGGPHHARCAVVTWYCLGGIELVYSRTKHWQAFQSEPAGCCRGMYSSGGTC